MNQKPQSHSIIHCGEILHFVSDPGFKLKSDSFQYWQDGALYIIDGKISKVGPRQQILDQAPENTTIIRHANVLLMPGFVDLHTHYPQMGIIGSYGEQLLSWLNTYAFPEEIKFSDQSYAPKIASQFLDTLLQNGTTTAAVFATSHKNSVEVFFTEAEKRGLAMICGKVMMDRNAPRQLLDNTLSGFEDTIDLLETWHRRGRLLYAVTPRFAPTSSQKQLRQAGELLAAFPSVYLQTHLSENKDELAWVKKLFPRKKNFVDVYDQFNLLTSQSIFAHSIHLQKNEWQRLAETKSAVAFCPTSNLFLGSGLFNFAKAQEYKIKLGFGTDIGGGTSFSMMTTMAEGYKVCQLQKYPLPPWQAYYHATLGGAKALSLDREIGSFESGKFADFIAIDLAPTEFIGELVERKNDIWEKLFLLNTVADDRAIKATYVQGIAQHEKVESF